jgi:hypothetical protein
MNMKTTLLIIAGLAIIGTVMSVAKSKCNIYKCSETNPSTDTGKCYQSTANTDGSYTFELNTCKNDFACTGAILAFSGKAETYNCSSTKVSSSVLDSVKNLWNNLKDKVTGSDVYDALLDADVIGLGLVVGQRCKKDINCYGVNTCSSNKCLGKDDGAACESHKECKNACISKKCGAQLANGASCMDDMECGNGSACSSGKCASYNSVANGQVTTNMQACTSGFGHVKVSGTGIEYTCDTATISNQNCVGDNDVCEWKYASAGTTMNMGCNCVQWSSTQERVCMAPKVNTVVFYTGRHTTLRFTMNIDDMSTAGMDEWNTAPACYKKALGASSSYMKVGILLFAFIAALFF